MSDRPAPFRHVRERRDCACQAVRAILIPSELDVYSSDVKSTDLFRLGRRLMELAEEGLPGQGVNNGVRFVLLDIATNPGSSISEITVRTGYPQSHVSTSVIKLRQLGFVRTEVDPSDRRRTLVWTVPEVVKRAHNRIISKADVAIRRAMGNSPASEVAEVIGALEMVAERLVPYAGPQAAKEAS
jgi:DNA-binding MarR family transcriptional regulator